MISWHGLGYLAILVPGITAAVAWILSFFIVNLFPTLNPKTIIAFGIAAGAPIVWHLGNKHHSKPGKTLIDPETHEKYHFEENHRLIGLKLQYWALIIPLYALYYLYFTE
jgi:hypothetical protein